MNQKQNQSKSRDKTNSLLSSMWRALSAAFAVCASMGAQAGDTALYAGAHAGSNDMQHWPLSVDFGGVSSRGELGLERKAHWGLFVGRQFDDKRIELEYQQGRIDVARTTLGPVAQARSGRGDYQVLMLNGYRVLEVRPDLNLYGALGVGLAHVSLPGLPPSNGCNCFRAASNTDFAIQARMGVEYRFARVNHLFLQLTAIDLPGLGSGGPPPSVDYHHQSLTAVSLGYRRQF